MELIQTFQDDCATFGSFGRVNLLHFTHDVREAHVAAANKLVMANPTHAYFAIIGENANPPNDSQRKRLMEPFATVECPVAAIVFLQSGFRSAVARSVITAMVRVGRISFPMKPCATISDGVEAIQDRIGQTPGLLDTTEHLIRDQVQLFRHAV